jgi:hypothetical protein
MSDGSRCFYTACGLSIASDAPVAGLRPTSADRNPDVTISSSGFESGRRPAARSMWYVSPEVDACGRPEMAIETDDEGYWLTYNDEATFLVDPSGSRIVVHWPAMLSEAETASHLSGSVLAFVLRLRRAVPLHASAIVVDDEALLFVGEPWAGKSTTVAAFSTIGCPVLADDIVRIDVDAGRLSAYPGHPRLHLWDDAAAHLFGVAKPDTADYYKHALDLAATGCSGYATSLPIGAVYLLQERVSGLSVTPSVEPVSTSAAVVALTRHTYGGCFLDSAMRAREFDVLCQLVEQVPVRQLTFSDDLATLPASCEVLAARHRP